MTPLDAAHAAMQAAPDDDGARLAFHARLAEAELHLLLAEEAEGDRLTPQVFALEDGPVVLAFDTDARLAEFAGATVPYAALPGRRLVALLAGQGVGLGVNLDVAPSAWLMPPDAVDWLAATLAEAPAPLTALPEAVHPPTLPPGLVAALDGRLARAAGLAQAAWLAGVSHGDGSRGHLLVVIDPAPGAEAALAQALSEAVRMAGVDHAGALDIAFLPASAPLVPRLERVALRFDLPPPPAAPAPPPPPGSDPARPPRLR
ncbi:MAG: SseB family protein [Alkalilacustris sp.]